MPRDSAAVGMAGESLREEVAGRVWDSEGQYLVDNFWGRYILLMKSHDGSGLVVLRDPTGAVPCFAVRFKEISIACSHIADCDALELIAPAIDWEHLAAYLRFDNMITPHTGLAGVRQVQAGERVTLQGDQRKAAYCWSPDRIYGIRAIESPEQAMRELRRTIQNCVTAWAGCYDSLLHELSGGLDSAVVLACLSHWRQPLKVVCENHYTRNAEGDERHFARQAATAAGVEMIETPIPFPDCTIEGMLDATRVASPAQVSFIPATQLRRREIVKDYDIEVVFSGQGGDHFFQSIPSRHIAAEYFTHHGIRRELFEVIADTSRFVRKSYWSVLGTVIASGLFGHRTDPYRILTPSPLLSDAVRQGADSNAIRHPWVDSAVDMPNSKRRQVFDIIDTQNFYRLPDQSVDVVHPLISQPVIELCLQIPSYILTYGGRDRALVRDAFRGLVPDEIINRTNKGATTSYFNSILIRSAAFLRDYLVGGLLAEHGLIDKTKTEAALRESALIRGGTLIFPVLDALRAEFWLRQWSDPSRRIAT